MTAFFSLNNDKIETKVCLLLDFLLEFYLWGDLFSYK